MHVTQFNVPSPKNLNFTQIIGNNRLAKVVVITFKMICYWKNYEEKSIDSLHVSLEECKQHRKIIRYMKLKITQTNLEVLAFTGVHLDNPTKLMIQHTSSSLLIRLTDIYCIYKKTCNYKCLIYECKKENSHKNLTLWQQQGMLLIQIMAYAQQNELKAGRLCHLPRKSGTGAST